MDPLQQPVSEVPAVAEPQQLPAEELQASEAPPAQEVVPSEPGPLEQPALAPVSVNIEQPLPAEPHTGRVGLDNGYNSDSKAHYHSRSTDFHHSAPEYAPPDADAATRLNSSPSINHQQPQLPPASRPGSGFSSGPERHAPSQLPQPPTDAAQRQPAQASKNSVVIKVGMVGDAQIGKTSLMVKYVEGSWDEDYIQTLGVNFMEKTISIRNTEITFSIWDLGGQREFVNMLPLVCNDAVAILFMFDLTRKSTLNSIKEWYRQGRGFNKTAIPFLVGTKYDHFVNFPREDQEEISLQAKRFAKAMKASLIFSSTSHSINVQKIFKIVLAKAFDLKCTIPEIENVGEPLLLYKNV
ncbi:Septum-promoting GTP-binding protein 1 [Penicillium macrosclerotiorum]|uniref:Septum-promoting GTP-binding protein 1 n=1 Tax=Penicillium macrosclerotiorum TaxID=303699 RepID=UPI00254857D4|nr:Septum-promoting GTP-binding protein 1 [Penicillium macrosclerotiorum]KAJ5690716.1 Septum-promoting GTP-binding protein 1 [Penicillium macrosclerotiorum]